MNLVEKAVANINREREQQAEGEAQKCVNVIVENQKVIEIAQGQIEKARERLKQIKVNEIDPATIL